MVIALPTYIGKIDAAEFLATLPAELDAAPKVLYRIRDAIGSVGTVGSSPDSFFLDPFCLRLLRCPTGLVHAASKYRGGDGALTHKFIPAANGPGRCLACSRLSGIVAIALVVVFEFELERRTLDWSISFNSDAVKHTSSS